MGTGTELRDQHNVGRYIRERILKLDPQPEPIPFRGKIDVSSEALPFFDEMDASLRNSPGTVWNVLGPSGSGKSCFARWAAARWGERFLADPETSCAVLWVHASKLKRALADDRGLTGGPFAFALAAEVEGESPESLARLLTKHPWIAIVDKDQDPELSGWTLELPVGLPPTLRVLHLSIRDTLGGPSVRMELWDRETSLFAAHRRHGPDGVQRIEALESSPAAGLAAFPPFLTWLLEQDTPLATIAKNGAYPAYLASVHSKLPGGFPRIEDWCEKLLESPRENPSLWLASRWLGLESSEPADTRFGRALRACLLAELIRLGKVDRILEARLIEREDLELLGKLQIDVDASAAPLQRSLTHPYEVANAANLYWWLGRKPLPPGFVLRGITGLQLPGHRFEGGLQDIVAASSDFGGISSGLPFMKGCRFEGCSLREASLAGIEVHACKLIQCSLELADFSSSTFKTCIMEHLDLTQAIFRGATFDDVGFLDVVFGDSGKNEPLRFSKCVVKNSDVTRMAASGFFFKKCQLGSMSFAGLSASIFCGEESHFEICDFHGFSAPNARLEKSIFERCILADANLQGADLRHAKLTGVEFQPGPAARAGHTDTLTRSDPMHGSKSGFYAQELADGVYLDPDVMRTADFRDADLRGAVVTDTDLFRVDLRGAKLDPSLREEAIRMRAFVD